MKFTNWEKKNAGLMIKTMISQAPKNEREDILDGYASAFLDENSENTKISEKTIETRTKKQKENFSRGYLFYKLEDSLQACLRNGYRKKFPDYLMN